MSAVKLTLVEEQANSSPASEAKPSRSRAKKLTHGTSDSKTPSQGSAKSAPAKKKASAPKTKKREATAKDVMQRPAIACHLNQSLNDAARLMFEQDLGAIVVVNDAGEPVSMITDRDICIASYTQGRPLYECAIASAMSKTIMTCGTDTSIDEIRDMMIGGQLRRIPVVDAAGKVAGMIGLSDLLEEAQASLPKDRKRGSTSPMIIQTVHGILQSPN